LKELLPDLEYGRETHVLWRDCHQKYRDQNPHIGDVKHHDRYVEIYGNRISTVMDAIDVFVALAK